MHTTKGVLSPGQASLSLKQRSQYNQLVQQGIDPKIARQLAIALTKSAAGLKYEAESSAWRMALRKVLSWTSKRGVQDVFDRHGATFWSDKVGAPCAKKLSGQADDVAKGQKPLGAAFAHAKRKQKEEGGSLKNHANDWLKSNGHEEMKKAAEGSKSYERHFVEAARAMLPGPYFDHLHQKAKGRAGGEASGRSRAQAMADAAMSKAITSKAVPLIQEVAVDKPVGNGKKKKKGAADLAKAALMAAQKQAPAAPQATEPTKADFVAHARVVKAAQPEWKRIVHSVVYAPGDVDAHGDYMDAETIEKMAHDAMRSGLYVNNEHEAGKIEADVVESYVAPQDFDLTLDDGKAYHIPKGSHVMAMHVWGDEPWGKVLSGEYAGFSLEGTALRHDA